MTTKNFPNTLDKITPHLESATYITTNNQSKSLIAGTNRKYARKQQTNTSKYK